MSPLFFALVDAVLMERMEGLYEHWRRYRSWARNHGDADMRRYHHIQMVETKIEATGWWRSLWGVL